ncbi:hypothetical protein C8R43DRAFT_1024505 [Mycena crocata]|nr:hypothetical protein C8R43DRAFT_1024505 [Mycena crocata]
MTSAWCFLPLIPSYASMVQHSPLDTFKFNLTLLRSETRGLLLMEIFTCSTSYLTWHTLHFRLSIPSICASSSTSTVCKTQCCGCSFMLPSTILSPLLNTTLTTP